MRFLLRLLLVLLAGTCILAARWAERQQSSPASQLAPAHPLALPVSEARR